MGVETGEGRMQVKNIGVEMRKGSGSWIGEWGREVETNYWGVGKGNGNEEREDGPDIE